MIGCGTHKHMRLDRMTQVESRTHIRTHMALAADRCCSLHANRCFTSLFIDNNVILRKHQNSIRGLGHRHISGTDKSHHGTAHKVYRIFDCGHTCHGNYFTEGSTDGHTHCHRMFYLSHYRYKLVCNRLLFFYRAIHIINSLYVKYGNSLFDRKSARTYNTSCCFINQYDLIAHRIYFRKFMNAYLWKFVYVCFQSLNSICIRLFYADNCFVCTYDICHHAERFHDLICMLFQQLSVEFQKRFTLGTVQKNCVGSFIQLCICGKSRSAGANDTILLQDIF